MGYALNDLGNLPVDANVRFYIFVVNGRFREPLYEMMQENFFRIAADIGGQAVIAVGTDPAAFTRAVARKYLGEGNSDAGFIDILPALLITDTHPEQLTKASMRLVVPLADAESRMGGWHQFFDALGRFARGEDDEFLRRFENRADLLDAANRVLELRPGLFGISVNVNELLEMASRRIAARKTR